MNLSIVDLVLISHLKIIWYILVVRLWGLNPMFTLMILRCPTMIEVIMGWRRKFIGWMLWIFRRLCRNLWGDWGVEEDGLYILCFMYIYFRYLSGDFSIPIYFDINISLIFAINLSIIYIINNKKPTKQNVPSDIHNPHRHIHLILILQNPKTQTHKTYLQKQNHLDNRRIIRNCLISRILV